MRRALARLRLTIPTRSTSTTVLEVLGIGLIVAGFAMFSVQVGLIVGGLGLILIGWRLA